MTDLSYGPFISRKQALEQGLKLYFTGKRCKNGHVATRFVKSRVCTVCNVAYQARYHQSDKGKQTLQRMWDKQRQRKKDGDPAFVASLQRAQRKYRQANKEKAADYARNKRVTDPKYLVRNRLNSRLHTFLTKKTKSFQGYVGCTWDALVLHLEQQFAEGMTWENHGEWHIDHIRPCASFDLTDPEQQRQCFHYTNLQPLWAEDNRRKSDHWVEAA